MKSNVKQERVPVAHLFHSTPQPSAPSYESGTSPPQITPNFAGKLISFGMEAPSEGTISDEMAPVQVVWFVFPTSLGLQSQRKKD